MEDMELDDIMMEAIDHVADMMEGQEPDFATSSIIALRDWLNDHYGDDTGNDILKEVMNT